MAHQGESWDQDEWQNLDTHHHPDIGIANNLSLSVPWSKQTQVQEPDHPSRAAEGQMNVKVGESHEVQKGRSARQMKPDRLEKDNIISLNKSLQIGVQLKEAKQAH